MPDGKHIFGLARIGEKGQIVIPKRARDVFDLKPGDQLLVLGDEAQGLALVKAEQLQGFAQQILAAMRDGSQEDA